MKEANQASFHEFFQDRAKNLTTGFIWLSPSAASQTEGIPQMTSSLGFLLLNHNGLSPNHNGYLDPNVLNIASEREVRCSHWYFMESFESINILLSSRNEKKVLEEITQGGEDYEPDERTSRSQEDSLSAC